MHCIFFKFISNNWCFKNKKYLKQNKCLHFVDFLLFFSFLYLLKRESNTDLCICFFLYKFYCIKFVVIKLVALSCFKTNLLIAFFFLLFINISFSTNCKVAILRKHVLWTYDSLWFTHASRTVCVWYIDFDQEPIL